MELFHKICIMLHQNFLKANSTSHGTTVSMHISGVFAACGLSSPLEIFMLGVLQATTSDVNIHL